MNKLKAKYYIIKFIIITLLIITLLLIQAHIRNTNSLHEKTSIEQVRNENNKENLIIVDSPKPNTIIKSPLKIEGKSVGYWLFEGNAPIVLTNWDGLIIKEYYVTALENWMTDEFVSFESNLSFEKPEFGKRGFLILQKSNASGLPENDDAIEIPIFFE
ncbi:hypothetical protein HON22_02765 [Candidatus Peregrinibacteria bacterium]|jgi:hypothetical protein|nr:hypothetical protein [Candidatus Peregrinibacteria bacterium]